MTIKICKLSDRPDMLPAVADALFRVFRASFQEAYGVTKPEGLYLELMCSPNTMIIDEHYDDPEYTFTSLVGFCNIVDHDYLKCIEKTVGPWLANVYVTPHYRGKGYGNLLVQNMLKTHITRPLFLWADDKVWRDWYSRRFEFQEIACIPQGFDGKDVYIMKHTSP